MPWRSFSATSQQGDGGERSARRQQSKVVKQLVAIDQFLKVERGNVQVPWIKTTQAHTIFGGMILANAVFIGVDVELGIDGFNWPLWITETVFLVIFAVEIILRLLAERPYWRNYFDAWGIFDLAITVTGCIDAWIISIILTSDGVNGSGEKALSSLNVLRMFRLVRLVRLVRVLRMFSELVVLVQTIGSSIMAVAWMSLLLFLVMYTGSIVTVLLIGQPYKDIDPDVDKYFGSLANALFTHFCVVTLENWPDIADTAMRHSQWWAAYFVALIVFTNFALVNLMVGVIVQRIILLSREQETELACFAAESDQFRITLQTLFNSMHMNVDLEVTRQDIRDLLKKQETHEIMSAFGVNLSIPAKTLYTIMDIDRDGTTSFDEFFDACIRLCGSQHSVHSVFVQSDICKTRQDLSRRMARIEHLVDRLGKCKSSPRSQASAEADVRELLGRMDRLGQAQERMLADIAGLATMKERARAGAGDAKVENGRGAAQAIGPGDEQMAPKACGSGGGAESARHATAEGCSENKRLLAGGSSAREGSAAQGGLAKPSRGNARSNARSASAGPAQQDPGLILHKGGLEIGACCISMDPLTALQPPRSEQRQPEQRQPPAERPGSARSAWRQEQDLRAANRRELEAEYRNKTGAAVLS